MSSSQNPLSIKREICRDVVFEHISTQLLEADLINDEEYQKIKTKGTDYEQTTELLKVLSKKGANVYKLFARVLETDYPWIAEVVVKTPELFDASASPTTISTLPSGISEEIIKMVQRNYRVADNWTTIAHSLGLTKLIMDIRVRININGEKNSMCIIYLLQEWKARCSNEATLDNLIQVLREEEFNDIADQLEAKFA